MSEREFCAYDGRWLPQPDVHGDGAGAGRHQHRDPPLWRRAPAM